MGYSSISDEQCVAVTGPVVNGECDNQSGPGGLKRSSWPHYHSITLLLVSSACSSYGQKDFNVIGLVDADNATNWYGKLGIRRNFSGYGETALYIEYTKSEDVTVETDADQWGVGVGQDVDAVGGTMYLGFRHSTADLSFYGIDAEDARPNPGGHGSALLI